MAGDWIKVQTCTPDKPEVHMIADYLGIDPDAVTGKLIRIWCWADQQTSDGNAPSVTKSLLDRFAGITGFADALISVGWLEPLDGGFRFPNFDRHNGNSAKTRASGAKRVEKHRKTTNSSVTQMKQKCNAQSVTAALPEKRREEINNIETRPREDIIPTSLNDVQCIEAAERWFDYLDSKQLQDKSPRGNEIALEAWWAQMARLGRDGFIEAVQQSIAAGRWNVTLKPEVPSSNRKIILKDREWIKALKAARDFTSDYEKRAKVLGPELFEALKKTGTRAVAESNSFEQKTLKELFYEHLKDIRNAATVGN
jgi:hypothetical protein